MGKVFILKKRIFIGSFVDKNLTEKFYPKIKKDFGGVIGGKWVPSENLHITYKFLGNIEEDKIYKIKKALSEILDKSFNVNIYLKGLSAFPNIKHPKVFFIPVEDKESDLKKVQSFVEEKLTVLGFEKESKPFKPHITLKRVKFVDNVKFVQKIKKYENIIFGKVNSLNINIIESHLTYKGAIYRKIA